MKLTWAACAVLVSTLCFNGQAVAAVDHDFGVVTGTETANVSKTFAGSESFVYSFEFLSAGTVFGTWASLPAVVTAPYSIVITTNATGGSFDLTGGSYSNLQYYNLGGGATDSFSFNLGAGSYTLSFYSDTLKKVGLGGSFAYTSTDSGTFSTSLTVAAVPEPETYAMMLAGLAAVGFMARRRKMK